MSALLRVRRWPLSATVVMALLSGRAATAQEDFRSLDTDRPLKVTDAYPKKYLEWEFQFGLRGGWAEGGERSLGGLLALETGLFRNFEIGVGLGVATEDDGTVTNTGIEGIELEALYNFNQEGWAWPGVAIQAGAEAPTGGGSLPGGLGLGGPIWSSREAFPTDSGSTSTAGMS